MRAKSSTPLVHRGFGGPSTICTRILFTATILFFISNVALANYKKLTKKGNEAFAKDDFTTALKNYQEAEIEHPKDPLLDFNIGTALHGQADYDNAIKQLGSALETNDEALQSDVYYNLGSAFFRSEKFQEAIAAFQKTLELHPEDVDAKFNLELARKKLKEQASQQNQQQNQEQQQKQDQQQEQKQDQQQQQQNQSQQQDQQQDQQNQNQEQQDQQQDQQQNQEQNQGGEGEEEEQKEQQMSEAQQQQKGMSKQDAERILKAIAGDEKEIQKKMPKVRGTARYGGKTW